MFLSIARDEGMRLKINGKKAELYEVYDGFTAFYLQEGVNEIEITFTPKGFALGLTLSLLGLIASVAVVVVWVWKKRRLELPSGLQTVALWGLLTVGIAVVFVIYALPILLCAMG